MTSFKAIEKERQRYVAGLSQGKQPARENNGSLAHNADVATLELYLREIGSAWGMERGGWRFILYYGILPAVVCIVLMYLAFYRTPLKDIPILRIWTNGGIFILISLYWLAEAYIFKHRWFTVRVGENSVELRLWTGTVTRRRRNGHESGHITARIDEINHMFRVRSEKLSGGMRGTQYLAAFPTMGALRKAIEEEWKKNTFMYIYYRD